MSKPLRMILSKSFTTGIVPFEWKIGIVCVIYKKNSKLFELVPLDISD